MSLLFPSLANTGRKYSEEDLLLLRQMSIVRARKSFWAFRRWMNPRMMVGWYQQEVAGHLQEFWRGLTAGEKPILAITSPPQHGKSEQVVDFVAWAIGMAATYPEECGVFEPMLGLRSVYGSFSERLGVRANLKIRRMVDSERYRAVFPGMRLPSGSENEVLSREFIEFPLSNSSFRNTTIGGAITGEGLDLGVVDDPIRGRKDASSPAIRETAWNWFTDDLFTRFSENAALLVILTRWNVDDPLGRLEQAHADGEFPNLKILKYEAIATEDEEHRKAGEPLFPEHKSLEFLMRRKSLMTEDSWESLYQQSPFIRSGGMFPIDKFAIQDYPPAKSDIVKSVRYWDKAGTKDGEGAETAGCLMHRLRDGSYVIESVVHGRWAELERERRIKATAEVDGYAVPVYVEQEPGSGGKDSVNATIRNLAGFTAERDLPSGDKAVRAEPYASQVQAGNVALVRGAWNRPFLEQHDHFPNGKLKDFVDASSGAFNKVCAGAFNLEELTK